MLGHLAGLLAVCVIAATLTERDASFAKLIALVYLLIWVVATAAPAIMGVLP